MRWCALVTATAMLSGGLLYGQSEAGSDAVILREAEALRSQHQPERARASLLPLTERSPTDVAALSLLAKTYEDEGNRAAAIPVLVKALAAEPTSLPINNQLGAVLLQEHHDPEAMDRFETVLGIDLRNAEARRGEVQAATALALSARDGGNPEASLKVLEHASERLPDDPTLLLDLGIQASDLGRFPQATQALERARMLDPKNPDILYALARAELDWQHMPDAERDMRAYLLARPADASAHFGLGHILAMEQRSEEARAEFDASVRLQPKQTESYYQLGQLDLLAQHNAEAESLFAKVLASNPNHAGALTGMGELAFRAKEYPRAEVYLARAEKADPAYPRPHYYRGLVLARLGRKAEADAELKLGDERPHATAPAAGDPAASSDRPGAAVAPVTPEPHLP